MADSLKIFFKANDILQLIFQLPSFLCISVNYRLLRRLDISCQLLLAGGRLDLWETYFGMNLAKVKENTWHVKGNYRKSMEKVLVKYWVRTIKIL